MQAIFAELAVNLAPVYRRDELRERASWDEDAARDAVRSFLVRHLGTDGRSHSDHPDPGPQAGQGTVTIFGVRGGPLSSRPPGQHREY
jgi:hypothetical protein